MAMESKMGWVGKTTKFNTKLNISVNYFQAKINTIVSLCQRSLTYDIHMFAEVIRHCFNRYPAAGLHLHVRVTFLERLGVRPQSVWRKIVQHDHVCARLGGDKGLLETLAFLLKTLAEAADAPCFFHRGLDGTAAAPNVIVLSKLPKQTSRVMKVFSLISALCFCCVC